MQKSLGRLTFLCAASLVRKLPHFRGKYRGMNAIYSKLTRNKAGSIIAILTKPVNYAMLLNLDSAHERFAYCMGGYEADAVLFLMRLWDREGYFMDIGANVGLVAIPFTILAKSHPDQLHEPGSTITVAFEPVASNFASLQKNVERNGISDVVKLFNAGVGAEQKSEYIQVEGDMPSGSTATGTANILPNESTYKCERQVVEVIPVDSLVSGGRITGRCSLIKIDTDGYDFFALKGCETLLATDRPIVFGEFMAQCMSWHGQTMADVESFAKRLDYQVFVRDGIHHTWSFKSVNDYIGFTQDALMVPSEKVNSLAWCLRK